MHDLFYQLAFGVEFIHLHAIIHKKINTKYYSIIMWLNNFVLTIVLYSRNIFIKKNNLVIGEPAFTSEMEVNLENELDHDEQFSVTYWPPEYILDKVESYSFDIW